MNADALHDPQQPQHAHEADLVLTIVGCRAGMPAGGWPSSCYLLEVQGERLLFDCGPGAALSLDRYVRPTELTGVFLSHLHLDHCFDIVVLGKQLLYGGVSRAVPLYVPEGAASRLRALNHLFPIGASASPDTPLDNVFDTAFTVMEYQHAQPIDVGATTVTPTAMSHRIPSHGFRVEASTTSFAYSGDTGTSPALADLAADVDLFAVEATLASPDTTGHGHLTPAEAALAAASASVRRLVLTHLADSSPAWIARVRDEAAAHFDGPIHVATPGAQFVVDAAHR